MRPVFTSNARAFLLSVAAATLLTTSVYADCTYELFNIASVKGTSVGDFIDQISDECGMSVIVTDEEAENILKKQMNKTYLKNLTINEVLDLIIKENNLQYTLQNNVLKIAYLTTKTYQIDYISGERKGNASTNIRLSSNTGTSAGSTGGGAQTAGAASGTGPQGGATSGASSESGTNITSTDEVTFWNKLDEEVKSILNRPEDSYRQNNALDQNSSDVHHIYINKSAGLVTVSATSKQLQRLDKYIADLQKKMQTQVMIDVKIYSVTFSDGSSTGIDWSQLYALQNIDLAFDYINSKDVGKFTSTALNTGTAFTEYGTSTAGNTNASIFRLGAKGSLKEVIKFLKTQGDVQAVSNPKILTLNNQQALITSGTELFYKTKSTSTLAGGSTGTSSDTEIVSSVFAGVLLDITPEISNDGSITLRINPSISDVASQLNADNATRSMPPDLSRRQMSSVVTVQDGNTIIMGGLIGTKNDMSGNKIPLLGDIPVLGWLFKSEGITKKTEEMVIIIQPHIVKRDGSNMSLSDLGYSRMGSSMEKDAMARNALLKQSDEELKQLKELTKNSK
ncbi:MAG: pilus (MSHA type) biogenesis protein MshL [Sulfuricurvum sp.]|nr:pilus (MSHA type) biogenesis protein MshL [Sulfuricurvum sp.]